MDYKARAAILTLAAVLCASLPGSAAASAEALEAIAAEDGSVWERVNEPGFGNESNVSVTALCPFQGSLYALTRNDKTGFELWRTEGSAWVQVSVSGFTDNSSLHEFMNSYFADMIEFKDHLYIGVSSGYEGAYLYKSVGLQIWRYDGQAWEPVVSNRVDADEAGTISALSGCDADDGDTTATITDASKSWVPGQWAGGVLRITSGSGTGRVFSIVDNTGESLIIQQNEEANTGDKGTDTEFTVCSTIVPDPSHPELACGAVAERDRYAIGIGPDENGFGRLWNKAVTDLEVMDGVLYVSIAHNYEEGTTIWSTEDGLTFQQMTEPSFGLYHGYDPEGRATGTCLIDGLEDRNGSPVCSSATHFGKSSVGGTETLYVGGTGSSGCNGRGARVLRLDGQQWNFIVDNFVDEDDAGTNENGFGDAGSFFDSNFQAWSWAEYEGHLIAGIARIKGGRMMCSASGSSQDGAWEYLVGGDSDMPFGFDGRAGVLGYGANIVPHVYVFDESLYVGTIANNTSPSLPLKKIFDGADIWRATGPPDQLMWTRVTGNGFGDGAIVAFESFCAAEGTLYVAGSNIFNRYPGDVQEGGRGGTIFRLKSYTPPAAVTYFTAEARKTAVTLSWATDNETAVSGFNIWRSSSETLRLPYRQRNASPIEPDDDHTYSYTDASLLCGKDYFYRIECVSASGESFFWGPLRITTEALF